MLREKGGPAVVVVDRRRAVVDAKTSAVVVIADEPSVQTAYERDRNAFDERRGGLGLALPLARRVIEGHGGSIWSPAASGTPGDAGDHTDALTRGSAIGRLPLTE